jgi:enoyl-CoA hydratase/carnithine racemase
MNYRFLDVKLEDGVVVATIDDPENKNAVNDQMNDELAALAEAVERDPACRVLILTGSGHIFCSGGNIKRMTSEGRSLEPPPGDLRRQLHPHADSIRRAVLGFRQMSKPAIAAINGKAIGSGVGLAAGCDIRIASAEAKIGWVFVRRGIVPDDASMALMPQLIGHANAFYWGVTGRTLTAAQAKEIGFVQEVVEPAELLPHCRALAREIVEHCPPITVELFKMVASGQAEHGLYDAVAFAERAQKLSRATDDHHEALRSYAERRTPVWQGR